MQMTSEKKKIFTVLILLVMVGTFLRTYHLHDWLHFGSDQARDAILVSHVVEDGAPWPTLGPDAGNTHFKLGPMYYFFQISAARLFGSDPAVLAYPDVFFSILALPLFFFLLSRYFSLNLSLLLTGLYTVSFYVVEYARFAWNTNPIPFFVMLFLYATLRLFDVQQGRMALVWGLLLGVALGVGVQLHTLLLLLLPTLFFLVALYLLKQNRQSWQPLVLVIIIALLLNGAQIQGELQNGGANSARFLSAFTDRSGSGAERFWGSFEADVLDHMEANTHILSSLGDKANFTFHAVLYQPTKTKSRAVYMVYLGGILLSALFSLLGYGRLGYLAWKEKEVKKRCFLRLILLFVTLSFLVMFSIARGMPLRYFINLTIVPFILLGLGLDWLQTMVPKRSFVIAPIMILVLFATNLNSLRGEAAALASGTRGESGYVVLGQAEHIVDFMIERSLPEQEANFFGGTNYAVTYYKPLMYLAERRGFTLVLADRRLPPVSEKPYFFMAQTPKQGDTFEIGGYTLVGEKNFGRLGLHQLQKQ